MNDIFIKYGLSGAVIIMLLGAIKILWERLNKKDKEHKEERNEDRDVHLAQIKKIFEQMQEDRIDLKKITETYSKDSRDFSLILKELELILKNQNK